MIYLAIALAVVIFALLRRVHMLHLLIIEMDAEKRSAFLRECTRDPDYHYGSPCNGMPRSTCPGYQRLKSDLTTPSSSDSPKFTSGRHIDKHVTLVSDRRERIEKALIPSNQTRLHVATALWQRATSRLQCLLSLRVRIGEIAPIRGRMVQLDGSVTGEHGLIVGHVRPLEVPSLELGTPISECAEVLTGFCSTCGLRLFDSSNPTQTAFCQCVVIP